MRPKVSRVGRLQQKDLKGPPKNSERKGTQGKQILFLGKSCVRPQNKKSGMKCLGE